jgi:hypothetical protein
MKINTVLSALLGVGLLLLAVGCASYNHTQYVMQGPRNIHRKLTPATPLQVEAVREVMADVAKRLKFQDRTERSVVPGIIGTYGEEDKLNPVSFTARLEKGVIIIDILHQPSSVGESQRYQKVRDSIASELQRQFPNDFRMSERSKLR